MKKSRFSEEQFIGFIRQAEAGMAIKDICRKGGFSDATFYKWRAKFGGMQVSEAQRLRELERRRVVTRAVQSTTPPSVEYALTPLGRELVPALEAIVQVGHKIKTTTKSDAA